MRRQALQPVQSAGSIRGEWAWRGAGPGYACRWARAGRVSGARPRARLPNSARREGSTRSRPSERRGRRVPVTGAVCRGGSARSERIAFSVCRVYVKGSALPEGQLAQSPVSRCRLRRPESHSAASSYRPSACSQTPPGARAGQTSSIRPARSGAMGGRGDTPSMATARCGQAAAQAPQPVQIAASSIRPSSPDTRAPVGQDRAHAPHLDRASHPRLQASPSNCGNGDCVAIVRYQLSARPGTKGRSCSAASAARRSRSASRIQA